MAAKTMTLGNPDELSPQQALSTKLCALLQKPNDFLRAFSIPETRSLETCLRSDCHNRHGPAPRARIAERLVDLLTFVEIEHLDGFQHALTRLSELASCGTHRAAFEKTGVPQEWRNGGAWNAAMEALGLRKGHGEKNGQVHANKKRSSEETEGTHVSTKALISGIDASSIPYHSSRSSPNASLTPIAATSANNPQMLFDLSSSPSWAPIWEPTPAMGMTFPDKVFASPTPIGVGAVGPPEVSNVTGKRKRDPQEDGTEDEERNIRSAWRSGSNEGDIGHSTTGSRVSADSGLVLSPNNRSFQRVEGEAAAASTEAGILSASADDQELHQQALIILNIIAGFGSLDELHQYRQPGYANDIVNRLWQYHFDHASAEARKSMGLYESVNLAQ